MHGAPLARVVASCPRPPFLLRTSLQPPLARASAGCLRSPRQCHRSLESDRRHRGALRSWSSEQSALSYSSRLRPAVSEATSPPLVPSVSIAPYPPHGAVHIPRTSPFSRLQRLVVGQSAASSSSICIAHAVFSPEGACSWQAMPGRLCRTRPGRSCSPDLEGRGGDIAAAIPSSLRPASSHLRVRVDSPREYATRELERVLRRTFAARVSPVSHQGGEEALFRYLFHRNDVRVDVQRHGRLRVSRPLREYPAGRRCAHRMTTCAIKGAEWG